VRLNGCTIRGNGDLSGGNYGIAGVDRSMTVSEVTVHDVGVGGIVGGRRLALTNVTVLRALDGVKAGRTSTPSVARSSSIRPATTATGATIQACRGACVPPTDGIPALQQAVP
jgi:hypothetical protein